MRALRRSGRTLACLLAVLLLWPAATEARPDGGAGADRGGKQDSGKGPGSGQPDRSGGGGAGSGSGDGGVDVSGSQNPGYGTANPLVVENPLCSEGLDRAERRNCEMTGTPEGRYPTSNYGFEVHIDTGLDNIVGNFQALLAHIANAIWQASLFVLSLVMTLLGWALELNPFGDNRTMAEISAGLERFYRAFTSPWLVVAMVIVGAAGLWRGLVRRDAAGAIGGALFSLALMVVALWVIHAPEQSVGRASDLSNKVAKTLISAPQSGSLSRPDATYAEATADVWHAMTLPGFAALNFSNVDWALSEPDPELLTKADEKACLDYAYLRSIPDRWLADVFTNEFVRERVDCKEIAVAVPSPRTNAEIWLRNSPGSEARNSLWEEFSDEHPYSTYMAIQGEGGAWIRLPLVLLVCLGLLGGIALLSWIAIRLFVQAAVAFVLVLMTPLALFLPAFGESGRRGFAFWGLTLLGALIAKLVYAAILAVVLFATTLVASLVRGGGGVGALMAFLVMAALWWAVFLKREQLIATISLPEAGRGGGGGDSGALEGITGLYGGIRIGRALARPLGAAVGGGAAGAAAGGFLARGGADRAEGTRRVASGQLDERAGRRLDARLGTEREIADRQAERRREFARVGSERREFLDRAAMLGGSGGGGGAEAERADAMVRAQRLGERQRELREQMAKDGDRARAAQEFVERAEGRERASGRRWSERDLAGARELIRREADRPLESGAHGWRVGMSPAAYEGLQGREREQAHARVARELREDRLAFGAIPDRPDGAVDPERQRAFRRELVRGGAEGRRQLRGASAGARRERLAQARRPRNAPARRGVSR